MMMEQMNFVENAIIHGSNYLLIIFAVSKTCSGNTDSDCDSCDSSIRNLESN